MTNEPINGTSLPDPQSSPPPSRTSSMAAPPSWQSDELLQGRKEVFIHHGDEIYRLRLTRQGKLILYK